VAKEFHNRAIQRWNGIRDCILSYISSPHLSSHVDFVVVRGVGGGGGDMHVHKRVYHHPCQILWCTFLKRLCLPINYFYIKAFVVDVIDVTDMV